MPAARVVLSNNTPKKSEEKGGRGAKRGEEKKKTKVLNMYFELNVAGQASRHDGTTCMDGCLCTQKYTQTHSCALKKTKMDKHNTHIRMHTQTHIVRLKEMTLVLI